MVEISDAGDDGTDGGAAEGIGPDCIALGAASIDRDMFGNGASVRYYKSIRRRCAGLRPWDIRSVMN